jgi:transglutaminase-like putative cysteine protease
MSVLQAVRRANLPGPPEESVPFRVAATASVVVAVAACWSQGELSGPVALGSVVLIVLGNLFSWRRRANPLPYLKLILALAVVGGFAWFFEAVSGQAGQGDLAAVEGPLAVLFTWIQVTHAFDVPSRRDLGFSLAGSATLMAVAAAQAVNNAFALYVVVWAAVSLVGLAAMWTSMVGGAPLRVRTLALAAGAVVLVGLAVVLVLPAPKANSHIVLPSALAGSAQTVQGGGLVGGGAQGNEPVHAASWGGRTRVGGFLGFAGPLDTAVRGALGNQVVLRVRADVPSYWLAETFDSWDGRSWTTKPLHPGGPLFVGLHGGPPFQIPQASATGPAAVPDYQTFYIAQGGPNLIFHAAVATQVWFPSRTLWLGGDGTMRAGTSLGPGSVYTVESLVARPSPAALRAAPATSSQGLSPLAYARAVSLPHPYPRVEALARRLTAGTTNDYDKVVRLEAWIAEHTRYTTDIPPLAPGQDTVDEFLFGNRKGFCEQISTALAVMLRSVGVPAREAVGYVPGPFNPITDLYDVQAKDAHAWVQVWFPGYGWQSFDPTASVPLANPTPGSVLAHDLAAEAGRVPLVPVLLAAGVVAGALLLVRLRRRRPARWQAGVTADLLAAARRAGLEVEPHETVLQVADRLEPRWRALHPEPGAGPGPAAVALALEAATYSDVGLSDERRRELRRAAARLRSEGRRLRRVPGPEGRPPGRDDGTEDGPGPPDRYAASSTTAPGRR